MNDASYVGSSQAYEDGNGDGTSATPQPSAMHAWAIIVGALALLWLLGGVLFRTVRM